MSKVRCLYCGENIPESVENCPSCKAPSHFQTHGKSQKKQKRFIVNFILLVIFITMMIVWLPR